MRRKDINLIPDTDGLFVISIYVYVGKMHKLLPSKGNEVLGMTNIIDIKFISCVGLHNQATLA